MKKILIVKYTPRDERSNTKKLLDYALTKIDKSVQVDILDLEKEQPELFNNFSLTSYALRNYMGEELNSEQKKSLSKYDNFVERFKQADTIIFAYPMFNFTMPASVKAFWDMILLKGETWDLNENGYVGLSKDKEILTIATSGSVYAEEFNNVSMNQVTPLMQLFANFVGANYKEVFAQGLNQFPDKLDETLAQAKKEIDETLSLLSNPLIAK